ncbi:MAG: tetratricopeptide repeat protein [Treponema sp.]|nr:tetratricopeptide repeat protein [Treponema sp.]
MKKLILLLLANLAILFITSCVSKTAIPDSGEKEIRQPVIEVEEKKVEEAPNIVFAKELRKELENRNTEGAIALFEKLPEELAQDKELKMLLASLYYSNMEFDNASKVAVSILDVKKELKGDGKKESLEGEEIQPETYSKVVNLPISVLGYKKTDFILPFEISEDDKLVFEIKEDNLEIWELLALCQHASGNKKAYKKICDSILELDPYNITVNIQNAEDYTVAKKYKLARSCYRLALKRDPNNADALFGLGQTSYFLDDVKTAAQVFEDVLDIDPENPSALSYMGKIQAESENYLRAAKYAKLAIDSDPYNYDYWMDYGTYLRYQGKFDEAEAAWKHAVSLDPTYFLAYAYLAGSYDERDMFPEALENYRKVIETNPKYYFAYEEAALLEYHEGNYENAIRDFSKAYEYSQSWAYKLMIHACYKKLGKDFDAIECLRTALKDIKERDSAEYHLVKFYYDSYTRNGMNLVIGKINKETNSNKRGKMLFYLGLYCELSGDDSNAKDYYTQVNAMQAPMFFEYRLAEWSLGL